MPLKAKSNETNESFDDEGSKMKSYIIRKFKKFMKNANSKGFDKDRKQSSFSQFKSQDRGKKDTKDSMNSTKGIFKEVDEEKDLVESKFKKMDKQDDIYTAYAKLYKVSEKHEKLYRLATKKLSDVELDRRELSTKVDEANQTIGALWFENNFLAERTKKLEAELFQDRAQLERTSSAKLDEMLSFQKAVFDKTSLGYDFSSPNIASSSTTVFISPADIVNFENNEFKTETTIEKLDKCKSISGAPSKLEKKETRNPRTKKVNNKNSQPNKLHLCHHYGASGHTRPNCYKWLVTQ
ncbi:hypothetical protein SO802_033728 [Lithocarpus litseifolius]|uniref:Uncharacterized protein n=1 Tax=Lithocarpus litseifolius TaxID=425828 RepID=A0AAW2BF67_9ROSI